MVVIQVTIKGFNTAFGDQPKLIAHRAKQGAVVTDQHDRAFKFIKGHGKRLAGGQVQVVGRLIEQQQIGALPHHHAKHQAGFFTPTHAAHTLLDHVTTEVELP